MLNRRGEPDFESGAYASAMAPDLASAETEFDWRRTIEVIRSGKWPIAIFVLAMLMLSLLFFVLFPPTYKADGLIQLEQDKAARPPTATGDQGITYDINGNSLQTDGEIQVLQSRMVLLEVIHRMNLLVEAKPNTFPIIGGAIFRSNAGLEEPADVPGWLRRFAWGGESIDVPTFEVAHPLQDKKFLLRVTPQGYDLFDPDGNKVLDGTPGVAVKRGSTAILVGNIKARSGTTFILTRVSLQNAIDSLLDHLTTEEKIKESGVILLSYKAKDPDVAAAVINSVETIYLRRNTEWRSARAAELEHSLKAQLPQLKSQVDQAQQQLNAYQLQHGSVDVSQETQLLLQRGVELETVKLSLKQQREEAVQRFTVKHPMVLSIDEKLASIDGELQKLKGQAAKLPVTQQEMLNRTRDLDVANQLYTAMLNAIQQQQVVQAGSLGNVGGNVRLVDDALVPEKPSFPKIKILVPVALLLGGFMGVASVLGRHFLINSIYDSNELEERLGLAILARVPFSCAQKRRMSRLRRNKADSCLLALSDPDDPAIESLRALRSSLHFATQDAANNIIVVAGPTAGIGKSFVSLNLAALLALSGKRCVLIDADLIGGLLFKSTQLNSLPGLTDYLKEVVAPGAILQATQIAGLALIAQGTQRPHSGELLLHDAFEKLLKFLSARFDHVIIDTPNNLHSATAAMVGRTAGCTLLVLKEGAHSFKQIEESCRRLKHAGADVRGVIFNET
jgi:tyrosine-protein kinase Etk/Wzc